MEDLPPDELEAMYLCKPSFDNYRHLSQQHNMPNKSSCPRAHRVLTILSLSPPNFQVISLESHRQTTYIT